MAEPHVESPPMTPEGATPPDAWDETLGRALDAGQLDPALAATDVKLAGAFAAHQKLELLFALLRGEAPNTPESAPTQLGRYQVQSTLGTGAFGTVYLAHNPELNREVAIKVCRRPRTEQTSQNAKYKSQNAKSTDDAIQDKLAADAYCLSLPGIECAMTG